MAAGLYDSVKLEIDWGSGYVDVTAFLPLDDGYPVTIDRGRSTPYDDNSPAEIGLYLRNGDGRFTPDNPLSPYYPNVKEGAQLRFSVTKAAAGLSSNRRFVGFIASLEPSTPGGVLANSLVKVAATDVWARLVNRTIAADVIEQATASGATPTDLFPLDDEEGLRNLGAGAPQRGTVVPDATGAGSLSWSTSADDGDVLIDGQVSFSPTQSQAGSCLRLPVQMSSGAGVHLLMKVGDPPSSTVTLFQLFRSTGTRSLDLRYTAAGHLEIFDDSGIVDLTSFAIPADSWFTVSVTPNLSFPGNAVLTYRNGSTTTTVGASGGHPIDTSNIAYIVVGGDMNPLVPGSNNRCAEMTLGGVYVGLAAAALTYLYPSSTDAAARFSELADYAANYGIAPATAQLGTTSPTVGRTLTSHRNLADLLAELAHTIAGNVFVARDGTLSLDLPDHARPTAITATITLEADDVAETDQWVRSAATSPTRVTASSPYTGEVTAMDAAAEASGAVRPTEVTTCAISTTQALAAAQYVLNQADGLSLRGLDVELGTAANLAVWNLCNLEVGQRIRVAGVPTSIYGWSRVDAYVQGWKETWTDRTVTFSLETTPANVSEARWDTARWAATPGSMTVTSGTAVGTTATGTAVVTTSGGAPPLTTAAGAYPCDFDWLGERVTVTSAPASSVSPQTVTITARGVAPSVARAHAAGEAWDVADPGVWAP